MATTTTTGASGNAAAAAVVLRRSGETRRQGFELASGKPGRAFCSPSLQDEKHGASLEAFAWPHSPTVLAKPKRTFKPEPNQAHGRAAPCLSDAVTQSCSRTQLLSCRLRDPGRPVFARMPATEHRPRFDVLLRPVGRTMSNRRRDQLLLDKA